MVKTAEEILEDVFERIKDSDLANTLSGVVCFEGARPQDSKLEDAVLIFTSGDTEQVQEGIVTLNIYVPDKEKKGIYRKDIPRCREVSKLTNKWIEELIEQSADYLFERNGVVSTNSEEEIHQHFVVAKLKYKLVTN